MPATKTKTKIILAGFRAAAPGCGVSEDAQQLLAPFVLTEFLKSKNPDGLAVSPLVLDPGDCDEAIIRKIHGAKADFAGFSCYVWNVQRTLGLCRKLKLAMPDIRTALGGPQIGGAAYAEKILSENSCVDFAACGEGEETLLELVTGASAAKIRGLTHRRGGRIVSNPARACIPDIGGLPTIYENRPWLRQFGVVYYSTSRGCAGRCAYCREWSPRRLLPLERVESDLGAIFSSPRLKVLNFIDSVLDAEPERLKEVLEITARLNRKKVPCGGYFYFKNTDPEIFRLLRKAGFKWLRTGVESLNETALAAAGRTRKNISGIENALPHAHEFTLVPYLITHLPGEDAASFKRGLMRCLEKGLLHADFHCSRLRILPGSALEARAAETGLVYDPQPPHFAYSTTEMSYSGYAGCRNFLLNLCLLRRMFSAEELRRIESAGADIYALCDAAPTTSGEIRITSLSEDVLTDFEAPAGVYEEIGKLLLKSLDQNGSDHYVADMIKSRIEKTRQEKWSGHGL